MLPEPIPVPWSLKPLSSARTSIDELDDGRLRLSIDHDVVHGVTPEMIAWWFSNLEGDVSVEGVRYPRYRVWHPRDHLSFRYRRRPPANGVLDARGAVFEIHEVLGRDPRHRIDIVTDVKRLDPGGFRHHPRLHGVRAVVMDYTFERVPGGTRYRNSLTVGFALPRALRGINLALRRAAFSDAHGRAWLLHNVEEVGCFEHFLPGLFAGERS